MIYMKERVTSTVYHTTTVNNCLDILKTNRFDLTTNLGTSADQRGQKFYYFSVSRVKYGGYARSMNFKNMVNLVLDGDLFNQKYKGVQVDYWGPGFRIGNTSDMKLRNDENEERVVTDDPSIKNAKKYIKEVHIIFTDNNYKMPDDNEKIYKELFENRYYDIQGIKDMCGNANIGFYLYYNPRDFIIHNKKNTLQLSNYTNYLKALVNVDKFTKWEDFDKFDNRQYSTIQRVFYGVWETGRLVYPYDDVKISIENDIHNNRSKASMRPLIADFTNLMKKYKTRSIDDLFIKMAEKFKPLHDDE